MEQFQAPIDCDSFSRPVTIRTSGWPPEVAVPAHSHKRAELVFVGSGSLSVAADDTAFLVSARNAILIPPGTMHEVRMLTATNVLTAYLELPETAGDIGGCRAIEVSSLLHELLHAATDVPVAYDTNGRDARIMGLITDEVVHLLSQPHTPALHTPMPRNPRLLRVCRKLLQQYNHIWSIDQAAEAAGMGRRTFTRSFRKETGISFINWHLRVRLNAAACRLKAGVSITEVAFDAGYNNPSAFATMFKRCIGVSPSAYQAGDGIGHNLIDRLAS